MHYLTSNFNLLYSNSLWRPLKNQNVTVDSNFNGYFVNLINTQNIKRHNSFHIVIFLNKSNFLNNQKKIKSLKKSFNKYTSKIFFIYLIFNEDLSTKSIKKISDDLKKLKKVSNNLFFEILFENNKKIYNDRNLAILKFPFDISFILILTKIIKKKITILNSKPYKLIILDCDNTLWGGVLDEDSFSEIKYNDKSQEFTFKDFQKKIKELKNKGFLLSLCSKNNEKNVWNFLKKKKMDLQKKDFILSKINWNEKYDNINFIVKNLNLRFEDCIFIDDNFLEINKVKNKIKKINTFHLRDISLAKKLFEDDVRLNKFIISKDDVKKYKQYKLKSKFTEYVSDEKIAPSLLKGLKQKIKIFNCKNSNLKRAEELFNKTNQYNFSLNRYKSNDIINIMSEKKFEIKLFSLKDKFGDHGIIGAYVIEKKKENVLISDFVLSCRVLYRYVEQFILGKIISQFPKKNIEIVYKKTNVNSNLIPKFLKKQNFDLSRKNKDCFFYNVKFNRESIDETKRIF